MKDDVDLLALHLVGGRQQPERSLARERHCYGNPERWYEIEQERRQQQEKRRKEKPKFRQKGK